MSAPGKSKGKWGGARSGAGRKPKQVSPTVLDVDDVRILTAEAPPDNIETPAEIQARTAIAALVKRLLTDRSEAARVRAANAILDRGYGKPGVEVGGDQGPILPFAEAVPAAMRVPAEIRAEARKYARVAIEVLSRIAQFGRSESASVAAATSLLDRGCGRVGTAQLPDDLKERTVGQREAAARAAEAAATGRYATPAPPRSHRRSDGETEH
jgi:hypothetical protein